ncbi:unnamed protein product [Lepeophtheirus salmonis]|uniref:(salmon louse) hypothetical protein n=1 Tax=Lepeophtheirus salmonis TaxID=72036 RepID=A0A7R8H4I4_LEPSM|nr:unnamed protein product [Lepeophtheirus salmonis]CAF2847756.1 unnamed protein product [Lepeophtheirus salmonis]
MLLTSCVLCWTRAFRGPFHVQQHGPVALDSHGKNIGAVSILPKVYLEIAENFVDGGHKKRSDGVLVGLPIGPELKMEPYFVAPSFGSHNNRNISVYAGQTAYLDCRVRNLGAKRVSWVRHKGVTILAVGTTTFTSDERISSRYNDDNGRFSLKIKNVAPKDTGTYECQISTKPTKVWFVHLNVLNAKANILGEKTVLVEINSELNLTCVVEASIQNLNKDLEIKWFKDDKVIMRHGGSYIASTSHLESNRLISNLIVTNVEMKDSGNYTCRSSITSTQSTVKVIYLIKV